MRWRRGGGMGGAFHAPICTISSAPSSHLVSLVGVVAHQFLTRGQDILDDLAELSVDGLALDTISLSHQLDPLVHTNITSR